MSNLYDEVVYPNPPFASTQPNRLAAAAALFGRGYAPPGAGRVLEIGCGDGGNLIPLAAAWPGSEFFGFDLAAGCIARGRATVEALGLTNIRLEALDLTQARDLGEYDYVIAHGLYAWVPELVRDALMALVGRVLSPRGVAFISYNTLPGCRIRQTMRDLLLARLQGVEEPSARIAGALAFLRLILDTYDEKDPGENAIRRQAQRMLDRAPEVIFHDELGDTYAPVLVRDFAAHARAHGLQFLCEAEPNRIEPTVPDTPAARAMMAEAEGDVIRLEQYADLLNLQTFRQSLLCRDDGAVERSLDPDRLRALHLAADLQPHPEGGWRSAAGARLQTQDPRARVLFERLAEIWPAAAPLSEVDADLYPQLLRLHLARVGELYAAPRPRLGPPGERPRVWAVARLQLESGATKLTTLVHNHLDVTDPEGLYFLSLLDGARTRDEIAAAMAERVGAPAEAVAAGLDGHLRRLARAGLLDG